MDVSEYWHLRVFVKAGSKAGITVLDQTQDWIEKRVLVPRRMGTPITINGREITWAEIASVSINVSEVPSSQLIEEQRALDARLGVRRPARTYAPLAAASAKDVTDELIDSPVGSAATRHSEAQGSAATADPRKVMVVHGRDEEARRAMFDFLEAIGLAPQEWSELVAATGSGAPYIGQVLEDAFKIAKAVVVLFTPDDEAYLREMFQGPHEPPEETEPTPQVRPNVLFEAGMAIGVHPTRTILVELGKLRPFSDIYGRHVVRLDHTPKSLLDIAKRLKTAGCAVDLSGGEWASTVFPCRDAAQTGKRPQSSSSSAGELDFNLAVSEGAPITRIDLREETLHDFLLKQRQTLLRSFRTMTPLVTYWTLRR